MAIPPQVRTKFYALRLLALILIAVAAVTVILRPHDFGFRLLGLLAIFVALWIVRRSNVSVWVARAQVVPDWSFGKQARRVGPLPLILTAASLVACVVCYFLMYLDQLHGGEEVWPVYAFAVAGLALAITSSYVVMMIFRGIL